MDLLPLISSFGIIALAELGDKTQLSVIALAAEFDAPIMVFVGVMLALSLLTAIGIAVGVVISRFIPKVFEEAAFVEVMWFIASTLDVTLKKKVITKVIK